MLEPSLYRTVIAEIAGALGSINEKAVYVGGIVIALYVEDYSVDELRPTKDLDLFLQLTSFVELETLERELRNKGFQRDPQEDVMCRFTYKRYLIDVMSTKEIGWAPANPWFKAGLDHIKKVDVLGVSVQILSLSYFLASKFTAFRSRGTDPRTSHDFEDIVFILDNALDWSAQLSEGEDDVKAYLRDEFTNMISQEDLIEATLAHLSADLQTQKYEAIKRKLNTFIDS